MNKELNKTAGNLEKKCTAEVICDWKVTQTEIKLHPDPEKELQIDSYWGDCLDCKGYNKGCKDYTPHKGEIRIY